MKSNEILAFDLFPFGDYYRGQRASATASTRTAKGWNTPAATQWPETASLPPARWRRSAFGAWPASATPSQIRSLEDQPPEIQETTAPRHSALTKRRPTAGTTQRRQTTRAATRHTPTIAKRRHPPATPKGRTTQGRHPPATTKTRRMMLLNDLYTIDHIEACTATLRLNTEHPIFKGHFPDRPVLPGACQLQMIRELLSHITTKTYRLEKAAAIKFITPIDPRQNGTIRLNLQYGEEKYGGEENTTLHVTATLIAGEAICLKFNGTFQTE
jgi:3-hydroxyacyl-[acyl-carrier-protein] dehydratase